MAQVLVVAAQKGGAGKSTSATTLAGYFAQTGRTLLIDLDPQGNATLACGKSPADYEASMTEVFRGEAPLADVIIPVWEGLDLAPCDVRLSVVELDRALDEVPIPIDVVARQLEAVQDQYAWIVIDTPPSLGELTLNGLQAAQRVLIPLAGADPFGVVGLELLLNTVRSMQGRNPRLRPLGIVRTRWDERLTLSADLWASVAQGHPRLAMETVIPVNVALPKAIVQGEHIATYDPRSTGAVAYRALAEEVISKW